MEHSDLRSRLMAGERLLWEGRPTSGLLLTAQDSFLIPFTFVWLALAVSWTFIATSAGAPSFFTLWGSVFIAIGLFFAAGRFLLDARVRARTSYALTDQRILIVRIGMLSNFISIDLGRLPELRLIGEDRPRGTIRFGGAASWVSNLRHVGNWVPSLDPTPQFLGIEAAPRVFNLILEASRRTQHASPSTAT